MKFKAITKLKSTIRYSPLPIANFRKGTGIFCRIFSKKLERYFGTRPFSDLHIVVAVSLLMISLTVIMISLLMISLLMISLTFLAFLWQSKQS